MKKYKLREEVRKYFNNNFSEEIETATLDIWNECGVTLEALEEVPNKITLSIDTDNVFISSDDLTDEQVELMEKALNGELLDIDSLDINDFTDFYMYSNIPVDDLVNVLKQYLKETE